MGLQKFIQSIANGKGIAKSNLYSVYFNGSVIQSFSGIYGGLTSKISEASGGSRVGERILLLCDEATLPGEQSNTGNVIRYAGASPRYYPTNPIYTDLQLSFICDAEMQALKFLIDWRKKIYAPTEVDGEVSNRLNYPSEYQADIFIEKNERDQTSDVGITSLKYQLFNAWPYAVDSIPLSYGSSQLVKVTANFYYTHWRTTTK